MYFNTFIQLEILHPKLEFDPAFNLLLDLVVVIEKQSTCSEVILIKSTKGGK
jgi:hypothetical protein